MSTHNFIIFEKKENFRA